MWSCELCFQQNEHWYKWWNRQTEQKRKREKTRKDAFDVWTVLLLLLLFCCSSPLVRSISTNCCFTWELISLLLIRLEYIMWRFNIYGWKVIVWHRHSNIERVKYNFTSCVYVRAHTYPSNTPLFFPSFFFFATNWWNGEWATQQIACGTVGYVVIPLYMWDVLHCTSIGRWIIAICSVLFAFVAARQFLFSLSLFLSLFLVWIVCMLSFWFVSFWLTFVFVTTLVDCWCWVCTEIHLIRLIISWFDMCHIKSKLQHHCRHHHHHCHHYKKKWKLRYCDAFNRNEKVHKNTS